MSSSQDLPLRIKQSDQFFSRLLHKEASMTSPCPSFRLYYGSVSIAVPFMWESKPGTPKHPLCEASIPPPTPPPSYYNHTEKPTKIKTTRSNFFNNLIPKIVHKRSQSLPSSSLLEISLSPLSSSTSSTSILMDTALRNSWGRKKRFNHGVDKGKIFSSFPISTLCFGIKDVKILL
ncbi:hypothetical protein Ancab_014195 [Ancistrocladus abbreviatus]